MSNLKEGKILANRIVNAVPDPTEGEASAEAHEERAERSVPAPEVRTENKTELVERLVSETGQLPPRSTSMTQRISGLDVLKAGMTSCRRALAIVALLSIALNIFFLVTPIYVFQIVDRVLLSRSTNALYMLTILALIGACLYGVFEVLRRMVAARAAFRLETIIGAPLLATTLSHRDNAENENIQIFRDLTEVRRFMTGPTLPLLFDVPLAVLFLGIVFLIHPELGYISFCAALVFLCVACANWLFVTRVFSRSQNHNRQALNQVYDQLQNAEIVQAMGMLDDGVRLWGKENGTALRALAKAGDRNALFSALSKALLLSLQIAILGWGAWLALQGELTIGLIIAAVFIAIRALTPLEALISDWPNIIKARHAYRRIKTLLKNEKTAGERFELPSPRGLVTVENLTLKAANSDASVLNGLNFELRPGESLAIIGPTGGGKSVLARLMVGILRPTRGAVRLDGTDIRHWDESQFGEYTGYLPQDVKFFPGTIAQNISRMTALTDPAYVVEAAHLACAHDLISQLDDGYDTVIGIDGSPLSGGQRQRVALARAFFGAPRFVVLDEPNAHLDGQGENALCEALKKAKSQGVTVVTITKRTAILRIVDKILVLEDGQIKAFQGRDDLLPQLIRISQP